MAEQEEWDFDGFGSEKSVYESIRNAIKNFAAYMKGGSNLKQSFGAIFLSILTDVLAGLFLGKLQETLLLLPGLIVLIPGTMSMRGNIFGALGSRLSTAFHMEHIEHFTLKNRHVRNNIYSSITLTIFTSAALALIARTLLLIFGLGSASVLQLLLVSFIGGILSGLILLAITFFIAFESHKRKWDPDNVTSPMITALGDLFTIPALTFAAYFVLGLPEFYVLLASVFVAALAVINLVMVFVAKSSKQALSFRENSYKTIVLQSVLVMLFGGTLSAVSGLMIESNLRVLITVPLIITLLPAFLEEGGNIGNILSCRMATKLHKGELDTRLSINDDIKREFINSYLLAILVFPIVSLLVYVVGSFIGLGGPPIAQFLYVATLAGLILTTIVTLFSFFISKISFKYKIDPDNVTIPLISGVADITGVFILIYTMKLFGIV